MRRITRFPFLAIALAITLAVLCGAALLQARSRDLRIYWIDVEGGAATLIVAPSGESLLVDTGFPGDRDTNRIVAAVKAAGLTKLNALVVTHYHSDHVGGVPALAAKLPVGTFVDHGPTVEEGAQPAALYRAYLEARARGRHLEVKPGDTIPVADLDVRVVSSGGALVTRPLPGAGAANPVCASFTAKDSDPTENARSVGMVLTFGRFRMLDLGDLTWNKEHDLVCPSNLLGSIDLYLTSHHGLDQSGSPQLVRAIQPRVAVMNNGAKKGGVPSAWQIVRDTPGLLDLWQLHFAVDGGKDHNVAEPFIANVDETTAYGIKVSAARDGSFTVANERNGQTKFYPPRR